MKLSDKEVEARLSTLNDWTLQNSCLVKEFEFDSFASAIGFMNKLVPVAERLNHHPEWTNSYNKVCIKLTTHSEGGITDKGFEFALAAEKTASA